MSLLSACLATSITSMTLFAPGKRKWDIFKLVVCLQDRVSHNSIPCYVGFTNTKSVTRLLRGTAAGPQITNDS